MPEEGKLFASLLGRCDSTEGVVDDDGSGTRKLPIGSKTLALAAATTLDRPPHLRLFLNLEDFEAVQSIHPTGISNCLQRAPWLWNRHHSRSVPEQRLAVRCPRHLRLLARSLWRKMTLRKG